ncbi:unnamed protein product, partial [Rotaria sp. Silwood2]
IKMKLSFCQLLLIQFIIINFFQCQNCHDLRNNKKSIYKKLYDATQRTLGSLLFPVCQQILFNTNNIQSQYISSKGLSGRVIPVGTFTDTVLALEYLYGILCPIQNSLPRPVVIQGTDLVHIAYDKEYFITRSEFIAKLTGGKRLTFFVSMAFDKNFKLCGYDGQIRNPGLTLDALTEAERQFRINVVCTIAQQFCNGTLQQYSSIDDCKQYLKANVPYGTFDRGDQESV